MQVLCRCQTSVVTSLPMKTFTISQWCKKTRYSHSYSEIYKGQSFKKTMYKRQPYFPQLTLQSSDLLELAIRFLGRIIPFTKSAAGFKVFAERRSTQSIVMSVLGSTYVILFRPQSSCLCLIATILSFQVLSQLASDHSKITQQGWINTSDKYTHLSRFCLSLVFRLRGYEVRKREHSLRKDDCSKPSPNTQPSCHKIFGFIKKFYSAAVVEIKK